MPSTTCAKAQATAKHWPPYLQVVADLMGALHGVGRILQDMIDGLLNCDTSKGQQRPDQYTITPVLGYLQRLNAVVMQSRV